MAFERRDVQKNLLPKSQFTFRFLLGFIFMKFKHNQEIPLKYLLIFYKYDATAKSDISDIYFFLLRREQTIGKIRMKK